MSVVVGDPITLDCTCCRLGQCCPGITKLDTLDGNYVAGSIPFTLTWTPTGSVLHPIGAYVGTFTWPGPDVPGITTGDTVEIGMYCQCNPFPDDCRICCWITNQTTSGIIQNQACTGIGDYDCSPFFATISTNIGDVTFAEP